MIDNNTHNARPLPDSWVWTTIGKVAETTSGGTPSRKHPEYYGGTIPWIKSGELKDKTITTVGESITEEALGNSSVKIFPKGTPVVALYGATIGKTGILGLDAATNQAICAIFALENAFTPEFVTYWLQYQRSDLVDLGAGGAQPNISQQIIRAFHFPLAPLPEQHRIVAEIETQLTRLDAAVAALERAQANLQRYKASVLKAACEGRLLPTEELKAIRESPDYEPADVLLQRILAERRQRWEEEQPGKKYKKPAPSGAEGLTELPEGWCWANIDQVAEHRLGKMLDKEKNQGELRPYLRNLNVRWFRFDLSDVQYLRARDEELDNISVRTGDLVICEGGEPGRAAVWSAPESMVIQKALHRVRLENGVSPHYLTFRLASDAGSGNLEQYFTGSTIKHFTGRSLNSYVFPMPPTSEQHRIVEEVERRLSVVAALEAAVEANLRRAERLRQSILKRAFEGRLVPQDPDDEPASVLLERIQAQRAAEGKSQKKGKKTGRKKKDQPQQMEMF